MDSYSLFRYLGNENVKIRGVGRDTEFSFESLAFGWLLFVVRYLLKGVFLGMAGNQLCLEMHFTEAVFSSQAVCLKL